MNIWKLVDDGKAISFFSWAMYTALVVYQASQATRRGHLTLCQLQLATKRRDWMIDLVNQGAYRLVGRILGPRKSNDFRNSVRILGVEDTKKGIQRVHHQAKKSPTEKSEMDLQELMEWYAALPEESWRATATNPPWQNEAIKQTTIPTGKIHETLHIVQIEKVQTPCGTKNSTRIIISLAERPGQGTGVQPKI